MLTFSSFFVYLSFESTPTTTTPNSIPNESFITTTPRDDNDDDEYDDDDAGHGCCLLGSFGDGSMYVSITIARDIRGVWRVW